MKAFSLPLAIGINELPCWLISKEFICQCRSRSFSPWSERSPREGNGNPLQYSCLENPIVKGAWQVTVHGFTKESDMT